MEKESNLFIKTWKTGATAIVTAYEMYGQNPKEELKNLAKQQLQQLDATRPKKEKTLEEQCNKDQLELVNYLKKVAETGEM